MERRGGGEGGGGFRLRQNDLPTCQYMYAEMDFNIKIREGKSVNLKYQSWMKDGVVCAGGGAGGGGKSPVGGGGVGGGLLSLVKCTNCGPTAAVASQHC